MCQLYRWVAMRNFGFDRSECSMSRRFLLSLRYVRSFTGVSRGIHVLPGTLCASIVRTGIIPSKRRTSKLRRVSGGLLLPECGNGHTDYLSHRSVLSLGNSLE